MNFLKRGFKAAKSFIVGVRPRLSFARLVVVEAGNLTRVLSPPPIHAQDDDGSDDSGNEGGGFSHKKQVVVERPRIPVVQYAVSRYGGEPMGGVQGLWWYVKELKIDDDGDIANDFMVLDGDGKDVNEGEERRYKQANVEIRGVSRGNLLLAPYTLD
jgi:hypothetical protein